VTYIQTNPVAKKIDDLFFVQLRPCRPAGHLAFVECRNLKAVYKNKSHLDKKGFLLLLPSVNSWLVVRMITKDRRRSAEPEQMTFQLVENHTDAQLVGSIEVEYLSNREQRVFLKMNCEPPNKATAERNDDAIFEESKYDYDETNDEGVEVPVGFLEQLSNALMEGCANCHCAPFTSSTHCAEETDRVPSNRRSVGFDCLEIHEFYMTLGDHPSAVSGPPVSLDYSQEITKKISLDEYERDREPRRKRKELKLSYKDRKQILEKHRGFSTDEVNQAWLEALKIRQQRQETLRRSSIMNYWDEITESTQRKVNRFAEAVGLI
jgi:hypothetical protein